MRFGLRAVPLPLVAVALRAIVEIDLASRIQVGFRGRKRVSEAFVLLGDDPGFVFLDQPIGHDRDREKEDRSEENFAQSKEERLIRGHGYRKKFSHIEGLWRKATVYTQS